MRWVKSGRPYAGWLQFFNNSAGVGGSSVVDAINPSKDGYNYNFVNGSFQPTAHEWRHECIVSSSGQSASDRLSNGNLFVAVSREYMYEVDSNDNLVWQYSDGPPKAFRIECDHLGIINLLNNPCDIEITGITSLDLANISLSPNLSFGNVEIAGLEDIQNYKISVVNMLGKVVFQTQNQTELSLNGLENGLYIINIVTDKNKVTKSLILSK